MLKRILTICLVLCLLIPSIAGAAAYQSTSGTSIIREVDGATIPDDPANTDYQTYLAWKAAGGVPDPAQTLAQAQAQKITAIQAQWASQEQSGFPYLGKTFTDDPVSSERIVIAALAAQANPNLTINWLCSDGTVLTLNATQIIGFAAALQAFDLPLYVHALGLIQQVEAATTIAAVTVIPNW